MVMRVLERTRRQRRDLHLDGEGQGNFTWATSHYIANCGASLPRSYTARRGCLAVIFSRGGHGVQGPSHPRLLARVRAGSKMGYNGASPALCTRLGGASSAWTHTWHERITHYRLLGSIPRGDLRSSSPSVWVAARAAVLLGRGKSGAMKDSRLESERTATTCTCGHLEGEHSACNGECYLCACKHYTQAGKVRPGESGFLARVYRYILSRGKPASDGEAQK